MQKSYLSIVSIEIGAQRQLIVSYAPNIKRPGFATGAGGD